jgi:uncharacterized protein YbjT (DUF2867 family)
MACMKRVLVTGATGTVGRQVVSQLLATDARVRALTRDPDAAGLPPEAEAVRGDLTVPATLDECLDGVDAVFLVWTAPAGAAPAAVERIARHAGRIVLLTSPHQTPHPFFQQPNPLAAMFAGIERLIQASDVQRTFLRPGMFAPMPCPGGLRRSAPATSCAGPMAPPRRLRSTSGTSQRLRSWVTDHVEKLS